MSATFKLSQDQIKVIQKYMPSRYKLVSNRTHSQRQKKLQQIRNKQDQDQFIQPKTLSNQQKKCLLLISKLRKHQYAQLFMKVIVPQNTEPEMDVLDLSIIENNVQNNYYSSILQFWADIRKIWQYSYLTNSKSSPLYNAALEAEKYFNQIYQEIDNPVVNDPNISDLQQKVERLTKEIKSVKRNPPNYYEQPVVYNNSRKRPIKSDQINKMNQQLSIKEKRNLGMNIRNLPIEHLKGVWDIVSNGVQQDQEVLQFDLDALDVRKTRELEKYVNQILQQQSRKQIKQQQTQLTTINNEAKLESNDNTDKIPTFPQQFNNPTQNINQNEDSNSTFSSEVSI